VNAAATTPISGGRSRPPLTRRASLNALAALVDYGARVLIQLVLAPLMLRFLGPGGYGAWQVLQKLIGQATPAGGRPGEALKWSVAHHQSSGDEDRKRQQVGTALQVWVLFLPLVLLAGGVLAWWSPTFVHAAPGDVWLVRGTAALLVLNLVLLGLATVPQAVLQGENLGYRRLGLSTSILLFGGVLTAAALYAGWGLVGVAAATTVTTVLTGVTFLGIVRSQIGWWGVARPRPGALRGFVGLSGWFLLWNLVMQAIKGTDVIVLGLIGGMGLVTVYTLTSYVPHAITDAVFMVISATMPGLGGLVGAGEIDRASRVRAETLVLSWLVAAGAGAATIMWLPSFLGLWVGSQYDAGTLATVLICVMVLQLGLFRVDSNVIDLTLRMRAKVLLGLLSALLSAGLAVALLGPAGLGIPGLVLGLILGRLPLTVAYPLLVGRRLAVPWATQLLGVWRAALATVALFGAATWARSVVETDTWPTFLGASALSGVAFLALAYLLGLTAPQRRTVRRRARRLVRGQ
jgi:O-antigen/teichoic acid export membrane protein